MISNMGILARRRSKPQLSQQLSQAKMSQAIPNDPSNHEHVSQASSTTLPPNQPLSTLIGTRERYLQIGVPLYEASIKCDWNAAKAILDKYPRIELIRCSVTDHGETALHIAASANGPNKVEEFVKNLVEKMDPKDLELVNKNNNTALYLAAAAGNTATVKIMVEKNSDLLIIPGGAERNMMPLYAAAMFGHYEVVKYLYDKSDELGDGWTDETRGWFLEKCVESDMFDIAIAIVKKHLTLGRNSSILGLLARKPKAFHEKKSPSNIIKTAIKSVSAFFVREPEKETEALKLLKIIWGDIVKLPKKKIDDILRGPADQMKSTSGSVVQAIQLRRLISSHLTKMETACQDTNLVSQFLVDLQLDTQNIIKEENKTLYGKGDQALKLQKLISNHIVNFHDDIQKLIKQQPREDLARELPVLITNHINSMNESTNLKPRHSSRVVFVAAKMGNTKFLVELIRGYPDLIWKVNDSRVSIFHTAAKHRQEHIFNLLCEIGAMKDMITPLTDENENNMLHLVGKIAKQKRLADVSGFALQMQRELLWFEEVKKMIPPSLREKKNKDELTPHDIFTQEHKELVTQGEKWTKETANKCMVVAALIATIVFAAAFTVPGGYNQRNGMPMFYSKATFVVFVVADAISLFASSGSILIFLSILTSRYAERDFLETIPKKLMAGLATLFISIATMTLAFGVSFFILYHNGFLWIPILIGVFAVLPVILYVFLQYGLFWDVIRSTYLSRYLFKPQKHVLYYENPKV
ncbi:ankyrin repeat-containing domain, PGG domain protein [Artemisia annua]|uniref:Ankyrin repeat-containing domain, PGG domain protein n=1 Tax=Artemisia annua TaxID=35608 RepID=A0A2U1PVP9_ARTAN|nr:ankyrin repeat-containing domain, PGG domain protein [Artemisia annua]